MLPLESASIDDEDQDKDADDSATQDRTPRPQRRAAAPVAAANDPIRARQLQATRAEAERQNAECVLLAANCLHLRLSTGVQTNVYVCSGCCARNA